MDWYQLKLFAEHVTGVSHDGLHVVAGVSIQLFAAFLTKRSLQHPLPWLIVLVLELVNEANDLYVERWPDAGRQYGEGVKDVLLTMLLPLVLAAASRYRPSLIVRIVQTSAEADSPSVP